MFLEHDGIRYWVSLDHIIAVGFVGRIVHVYLLGQQSLRFTADEAAPLLRYLEANAVHW